MRQFLPIAFRRAGDCEKQCSLSLCKSPNWGTCSKPSPADLSSGRNPIVESSLTKWFAPQPHRRIVTDETRAGAGIVVSRDDSTMAGGAVGVVSRDDSTMACPEGFELGDTRTAVFLGLCPSAVR